MANEVFINHNSITFNQSNVNRHISIIFQLIGGSPASIGPRHNWKRFDPIPENVETAWNKFKVTTHLLTTADSFK